VLLFTDDDCYVSDNYFVDFRNSFDERILQYGMGQVLLFDPEDDPRVANLKIEKLVIIPPRTPVVPTGHVQGANMFFHRRVLEKTGLFNNNMGAGTQFPCEDIELASRASLAGFTGGLLPGFTVFHHHGRKTGSAEADSTVQSYDFGRGAYYASLIARGVNETWAYWGEKATQYTINLDRFSRELEGAAAYLKHIAHSA